MTVLTSLQVTSVLSYVIAVLVPALDAVFPVLPSETLIIALGSRRPAVPIRVSGCWSPAPRWARSSATTCRT